jgi:hypothetical protein
MLSHRIIATAALVLALLGCEGDGGSTDPTLANTKFRGITQTTNDPTAIGWYDPDDWRTSAPWLSYYPDPPCMPRPSGAPVEKIGGERLPTAYATHAGYPNPTADTIHLTVDLPYDAFVYTAIIDEGGGTVRTLCCQLFTPGYVRLKWDLRTDSGGRVAAATYRAIILVREKKPDGTPGDLRIASHGDILVQ